MDIKEFNTVAGASSPSFPWALASKPTASTAASTSGLPTTVGDKFAQIVALGEVYRRKAHSLRRVSDDRRSYRRSSREPHRGSGGSRSCQSYWPRARYVDYGSYAYAGIDGTVKASGQNIGKHRQVLNLRHGLGFVRELDQIEVCIRNQHVLGLAADPSAHIDIAVSTARAAMIDVETHARLLLAAGAAPPASYVERHRDKITDVQIFDVGTSLDDFTCDLVPKNQSGWARWYARGPYADQSRRCWWRQL